MSEGQTLSTSNTSSGLDGTLTSADDKYLHIEGLGFEDFEIGHVIWGPLYVHRDDHHATATTYVFNEDDKKRYPSLARAAIPGVADSGAPKKIPARISTAVSNIRDGKKIKHLAIVISRDQDGGTIQVAYTTTFYPEHRILDTFFPEMWMPILPAPKEGNLDPLPMARNFKTPQPEWVNLHALHTITAHNKFMAKKMFDVDSV